MLVLAALSFLLLAQRFEGAALRGSAQALNFDEDPRTEHSVEEQTLASNFDTLPLARRHLQQAPFDVQVLTVSTAKQLQEAVERGTTHIQIQEHLDLSAVGLRTLEGAAWTALLGKVPSTVVSIQGNCTEPPPPALLERAAAADEDAEGVPAPMLPLQPQQCLLVTDHSTVFVRRGSLWLDRLYLRLRRTKRTLETTVLVGATDPPTGQLYITNSVIQGDGLGPSTGLYVTSASYVNNTAFANLGYGLPPVQVLLKNTTTALFESCQFLNNTSSQNYGVITTSLAAVSVALQDCTFEDNTADLNSTADLLVDAGGAGGAGAGDTPAGAADAGDTVSRFYSTFQLPVQRLWENTTETTLSIAEIPEDTAFLSGEDIFLQQAQEALRLGSRVVEVDRGDPDSGEDSGDDGFNPILIAIIAAALLVPSLAVAIAVVLWTRARARNAAAASTHANTDLKFITTTVGSPAASVARSVLSSRGGHSHTMSASRESTGGGSAPILQPHGNPLA